MAANAESTAAHADGSTGRTARIASAYALRATAD